MEEVAAGSPKVQHPGSQPHFLLHIKLFVRGEEWQLDIDSIENGDLLQESSSVRVGESKFGDPWRAWIKQER